MGDIKSLKERGFNYTHSVLEQIKSTLGESDKKWSTECGGKKVKHGHKDYKIAPNTCKGVAYCTRSEGIKDKGKCSPNQLSRKKWKCRGKCSGDTCPSDCEGRKRIKENFKKTLKESIDFDKISKETRNYVKKFETDEALLRSGGIPFDLLNRDVFGFTESDIEELHPDDIRVRWKMDLENVEHQIDMFGDEVGWAKSVERTTPIEVSYMDDEEQGIGFYIEDGHHRWTSAKILGVKLPVELDMKINPIKFISDLDYDEFHRELHKKYTQV